MIHRDYLSLALETIETDATGPYLYGPFSSLYTLSMVPGNIDRDLAAGLLGGLRRTSRDLWDALTVIWRVEWQRELKIRGEMDDNRWFYFLGADVRELHVALRAFYDSVCILLRPVVKKPGQVSLDSFRKLQQRLATQDIVAKVGEDLAREITAADWFMQMRAVRDGLVHHGAQPVVFPQTEWIGFQISRRSADVIRVDGLMVNENIVDFELYSTVQIGQAIAFLQRLCTVILTQLGRESEPRNAKSYHPGLGLLETGIKRVLAAAG